MSQDVMPDLGSSALVVMAIYLMALFVVMLVDHYLFPVASL